MFASIHTKEYAIIRKCNYLFNNYNKYTYTITEHYIIEYFQSISIETITTHYDIINYIIYFFFIR